MATTKNQRRGRPPATPIDRLQARLWYYAVKARTPISDYQLDLFFLEKVGRRPKDTQKRTRLFETVRLHGTLPSSGKHHNRDFDLIELVDQEEIYAGTADIFHSPYWQLLTKNDNDILVYQKIAQDAMTRLGLARLDQDGNYGANYLFAKAFEQKNFRSSVHKNTLPDPQKLLLGLINNFNIDLPKNYSNFFESYEWLLRAAIRSRPTSLDTLVLLGALFREAYLSSALEIAIILKKIYCETLEEYTQQAWLNPVGDILLEIGENYLIFPHAHNCMSRSDHPTYDDWPIAVVQRPIWNSQEGIIFTALGKAYHELLRQAAEYLKNQNTPPQN